MDRLIEIKINGSHLTKDNLYAGVQGESNVTALRIEFDESWDGYAKTVVFWDAREENPVKRVLTADLLEDITASSRIYRCMIPGEPLAEAGECTIVIDGYAEGRRPRSVPAKLKVKPAPDSDNPGQPVDPTPSQAEQLQRQIDGMMGNIQAQAIIAHDAATAAGGHAQAAAASEGNAKQAAADAQAAQRAAENARDAAAGSVSSAASLVLSAETSAQAAANSAEAAASSAWAADSHAGRAKTSETNAAASAQAAYNSEHSAMARAQEADAAAERAENARDGVESSKQNAAQSASAAAQSATAAQTAESNAKAAQKAAEEARDAASEIAGGDFASKTEAQGYANAAEANANTYTDQKIAAIPAPDVSGQIGSHNTDTASHNDIRLLVDGKENKGLAAQIVNNHDADTTAHPDLRQLADGAVKKSGDTMTGRLVVPSTEISGSRISAYLQEEGPRDRLQILVIDKQQNRYGMLDISPDGMYITGADYIEHTFIHTGNMAQYMGVAQASLEE